MDGDQQSMRWGRRRTEGRRSYRLDSFLLDTPLSITSMVLDTYTTTPTQPTQQWSSAHILAQVANHMVTAHNWVVTYSLPWNSVCLQGDDKHLETGMPPHSSSRRANPPGSYGSSMCLEMIILLLTSWWNKLQSSPYVCLVVFSPRNWMQNFWIFSIAPQEEHADLCSVAPFPSPATRITKKQATL